jgi:hypothetical protein
LPGGVIKLLAAAIAVFLSPVLAKAQSPPASVGSMPSIPAPTATQVIPERYIGTSVTTDHSGGTCVDPSRIKAMSLQINGDDADGYITSESGDGTEIEVKGKTDGRGARGSGWYSNHYYRIIVNGNEAIIRYIKVMVFKDNCTFDYHFSRTSR